MSSHSKNFKVSIFEKEKFFDDFFEYDFEILKFIFEKGVKSEMDEMTCNNSMKTLTYFQYFGLLGRFDMIDFFLGRGKITSIDFGNPTILFLGCIHKRIDIVKEALIRGADINKVLLDYTPLVNSVENNNIEMVEFLLKNGAEPDLPKPQSYTALFRACFQGSVEIIKLLLEGGADPNIVPEGFSPPLFIVSRYINTMKLLLDYKADINILHGGKTILFKEEVRNDLEKFKFIDSYKPNYNICDEDGNNILHEECRCSSTSYEVLEILLKRGCDINQLNKSGYSPLALATINGRGHIIKFLLYRGAEVEYNEDGNIKYFNDKKFKALPRYQSSSCDKVFKEYFEGIKRNIKPACKY